MLSQFRLLMALLMMMAEGLAAPALRDVAMVMAVLAMMATVAFVAFVRRGGFERKSRA